MSGETTDLYFDTKENSTGTLMDGPDLAQAGGCLLRVHVRARVLAQATFDSSMTRPSILPSNWMASA